MRVIAMIMRILWQLKHDKRTLALMMMAPIMVLTIVYLVFEDAETQGNVGIISCPESFINALNSFPIIAIHIDEQDALQALQDGTVDATIKIVDGKSHITIDGSHSAKATMILSSLELAKQQMQNARPDLLSDINYVYGYEDMSDFDNFGVTLIGFIIFFFVFLVAGISFLQERTSGTLEKLLSTPIRRWEIVLGYVLGFGVVTLLQSVLISLYVIYVLDVIMIGSLFWVLVITFFTAMLALTLGILLSTVANNEFQMIQFVPLVVVPQVFFSGLFDLSARWDAIGKVIPLHYVAIALKEVMIKGNGLSHIYFELIVMAGLALAFMTANTFLLKKYRKI